MASAKEAWERAHLQEPSAAPTPIPEGDRDLWGGIVQAPPPDLASQIATLVCGFPVVIECFIGDSEAWADLHGEIQTKVRALLDKNGINL